MFTPVVADLAKPQWVAVLRVLESSGGMTTRQLAGQLDVSYMAAKQYGEDLTRLGYVERIRKPRTAVGRPEIYYRLAAKAEAVFPDMGMGFSLELLENSRQLFGDNAPDRLIYQHFETLRSRWSTALAPHTQPCERAEKLATLRREYGVRCFFEAAGETPARLIERQHPLHRIFQQYPRALAMDARLIEELLGTRAERVETARGGSGPLHVEFLLPDLSPPASD